MLYTRKSNLIFSDIQNRIFDFEVAALDVMNFEWSYIFPRPRINLLFVVSFISLGDIGESKLISETTLKNHISGSLRGIPILRLQLVLPWSQFNFEHAHRPAVSKDHGAEGRKCFTTLGQNILIWFSSILHECWCCIESFFGFPRIFNMQFCPWRGMAYHGGSHLLRVCVIWMVCASLCSRPCYISLFVGRYVESYVARASPMSEWCAP